MDNNYTTEKIPNTIDDKEREVLIIALIETLKHQKKVNAAKMKYSNW